MTLVVAHLIQCMECTEVTQGSCFTEFVVLLLCWQMEMTAITTRLMIRITTARTSITAAADLQKNRQLLAAQLLYHSFERSLLLAFVYHA